MEFDVSSLNSSSEIPCGGNLPFLGRAFGVQQLVFSSPAPLELAGLAQRHIVTDADLQVADGKSSPEIGTQVCVVEMPVHIAQIVVTVLQGAVAEGKSYLRPASTNTLAVSPSPMA